MAHPSKLIGAFQFIGTADELDAFRKRQDLLGQAIGNLTQAGYRDIAEQVGEIQKRDYYLNIRDVMPRS